ncbi:30S ribosome-binding factor RbfA [Myxococcota bacterium]|nr:30S ribosome-binding factor RbfA [Myxococcota bacterium]MBU1429049.1 30S ribosome-binding factor RbfA [Myxococcota bacterium]MBU1896556.1 30S ribosome-binding factor RbfA [Myxococcota bacterium]
MARTPFKRADRVAALTREILAELLLLHVKDPRVQGVDLTDVELSGDLREAKVFFYVSGDEAAQANALEGLNRAKGYLRRELGQRLTARVTPNLHFRFDGSIDYGARIERLLGDIQPAAAQPAEGAEPEDA